MFVPQADAATTPRPLAVVLAMVFLASCSCFVVTNSVSVPSPVGAKDIVVAASTVMAKHNYKVEKADSVLGIVQGYHYGDRFDPQHPSVLVRPECKRYYFTYERGNVLIRAELEDRTGQVRRIDPDSLFVKELVTCLEEQRIRSLYDPSAYSIEWKSLTCDPLNDAGQSGELKCSRLSGVIRTGGQRIGVVVGDGRVFGVGDLIPLRAEWSRSGPLACEFTIYIPSQNIRDLGQEEGEKDGLPIGPPDPGSLKTYDANEVDLARRFAIANRLIKEEEEKKKAAIEGRVWAHRVEGASEVYVSVADTVGGKEERILRTFPAVQVWKEDGICRWAAGSDMPKGMEPGSVARREQLEAGAKVGSEPQHVREPAQEMEAMYVKVSAANVRERASTSAPVVEQLPGGTQVRVGPLEAGWREIVSPVAGFISGGLLQRDPVAEAPTSIIGSTRGQVASMFSGGEWTRDRGYETNVDAQAVKFVSNEVLVVIAFDQRGVAEGVAFLSRDSYENCYVGRRLDWLLEWACGTRAMRYESDPSGCEVYIGDVHM